MVNIDSFFKKPSLTDWNEQTKKILKIEDDEKLETCLNKNSLEGISYRPLYTKSESTIHLNTFPEFRSYWREVIKTNGANKDESGGISTFLTELPIVAPKSTKIIQNIRSKNYTIFGDELLLDLVSLFESFDLDLDKLKSEVIKVNKKNNCNFFIDTRRIHNAGGSVVQEIVTALSFGKYAMEELGAESSKIYFGFAQDSKFFLNISKLRSFRYIWETVLENENTSTNNFSIIGFNSYREQTIYDPWMNMLRNNVSASASFLGGADIIVATAFDSLRDDLSDTQISELGFRQSRNMLHILGEESNLDKVLDPGKGSYTIENLSTSFVEESYELFKKYEKSGGLLNNYQSFSDLVKEISLKRLQEVRKRKLILSGINDFCNTDESVSIKTKRIENKKENSTFFPKVRIAQDFECLRLRVENSKLPKKMLLATFGDASKLSPRIMFAKNYFGILGVDVDIKHLTGSNFDFTNEEYLAFVFCAQDEDYLRFMETFIPQIPKKKCVFIASKNVEIDGAQNIFMGQNVYSILNEFVNQELQS